VTTSTVTDTETKTYGSFIIGDSSVSGRNFIGYVDELLIEGETS
jgi:hypothetical protein